MSRLVLAVLPTNQDSNVSAALRGLSEQQHIAPLAAAISAEAQRHPSITACVFHGRPQSADQPPGSLSNLTEQQRAAAFWIASARQSGDLTVSLNLHSDSGTYSHCGYYYDGPGTVSQWLGRALAEAVKGWFGGKVITADYSRYIFASETRAVACPILLEMGAHTQVADVAAVRDHASEIAAALVGTLLGFFGLETAPPLNLSELRSFGEWAVLRCDVGEDRRAVESFRRHVGSIGGDSSDLSRYGVPGLLTAPL